MSELGPEESPAQLDPYGVPYGRMVSGIHVPGYVTDGPFTDRRLTGSCWENLLRFPLEWRRPVAAYAYVAAFSAMEGHPGPGEIIMTLDLLSRVFADGWRPEPWAEHGAGI